MHACPATSAIRVFPAIVAMSYGLEFRGIGSPTSLAAPAGRLIGDGRYGHDLGSVIPSASLISLRACHPPDSKAECSAAIVAINLY